MFIYLHKKIKTMVIENKQKGREEEVERINRIAYVLKGIGHTVRLQIIDLLKDYEALSVQQIMDQIEVEQTVLSHHLAKMRDLGLLNTERDGKKIYYSLADKQIAKIISCMQECDIF